jgi:sensor histidine kinase YesM
VTDDGQGVPSTEVEQLFFSERSRVHALALLRRRLQGLFGRSFRLDVRSEIGEGTTVTMRIPAKESGVASKLSLLPLSPRQTQVRLKPLL